MDSLAFGTCHVSSQQMQEKMTFHPSGTVLPSNHDDSSSLILYFVGGEIHFELMYDLWKC